METRRLCKIQMFFSPRKTTKRKALETTKRKALGGSSQLYSKWLIAMISKSPNWDFSLSKWPNGLQIGVTNYFLTGMILQVAMGRSHGMQLQNVKNDWWSITNCGLTSDVFLLVSRKLEQDPLNGPLNLSI